MSPTGTPTAKVTTAAALNYIYITGGDRHLITILTFGTHVDILYYLSSPSNLFSFLVFLRYSHVSVTTHVFLFYYYVFLRHSPG